MYALAGNADEAFHHLLRAVALGWLDAQSMRDDDDLTCLHADIRWPELIAYTERNLAALQNALPDRRELTDTITLPEPRHTSSTSVEEAMQRRRSIRSYGNQALTLAEVGQVLWAAYGVTQPLAGASLRGGLKTTPSAGATYPLEVYLAAWRVEGLQPGIYLYRPQGHCLQPIRMGDYHNELTSACYWQPYAGGAPAALIYSAVFSRTTDVYDERGRERYVPMDLGHSAQNVYLQAEALGLGTVAIGAFDDMRLKLFTHMTKEEEPLYVMPLGKKPADE